MRLIAVVFGTRPEIIKLAPVVRALDSSKNLKPFSISTGQHSSLKDIALKEEGLKVDVDLNLMSDAQSLTGFFARCLASLDEVLANEPIEGVVVQGDTSSALAGALAAFYRGIPVFHVEAGLRTWNLGSPFPEEANRKLIAQIASLHFAPTVEARANLLNEAISGNKVKFVGNTIVDSLKASLEKLAETPSSMQFDEAKGHGINLVWTFHRRENQDSVNDVVNTLESLARRHPNLGVWLPVHPNPAVAGPMLALRGKFTNLHILNPLNHGEFIRLLNVADLAVTDSGGVQEEALSLGKRVLVLRDTTERPEVVSSGLGTLYDPADGNILGAVESELSRINNFTVGQNPYGDGNSAQLIAKEISEFYFRK